MKNSRSVDFQASGAEPFDWSCMVAVPIADELQREPSTRATMRIVSNRKVHYEDRKVHYEEIVFVLIFCGCGGLIT